MTAASFSFSRQIFSPPRGTDRRRQVGTPEFIAAERHLTPGFIASYLGEGLGGGKYQVHRRTKVGVRSLMAGAESHTARRAKRTPGFYEG